MALVYLIHWKEEEVPERRERLENAGHEVESEFPDYKIMRQMLKSDPPAAVVIDLSRLPSHGRELAEWLRSTKSTCGIPVVFVDGLPEKIDRTKQQFPDATYTTWSRIRGPLKKAIANPPKNPKRSSSALAGYSGTPLPKKLGIKSGFVVAVVNGPDNFEQTLGDLPDGVTLRTPPEAKTT